MSQENQTNILGELVGDGKKFATVDDLAKGKLEADTFIETLKQELAETRSELEKATSQSQRDKLLEQLMSNLNNNDNKGGTTTPPDQPSTSNNNQTAGLSHDDVVKLIEAREREAQQSRNKESAVNQVRKAYGDKTDEVIAKRASDLGFTVESLNALAATSPQAFVTLVGLPSRDPGTRAMANSTVNTAATGDSPGGVRNKAYYDGLKKELGTQKFYLDSKIQVQMHNDYMALGDAWEN